MTSPQPSVRSKCERVFNKNTYYFFNPEAQNEYEGHIHALRETLTRLKARVECCRGVEEKKQVFNDLLAEQEHGLRALLALTGFSNESFRRIITLARIRDDRKFDRLLNKSEWLHPNDRFSTDGREWPDAKIARLVQKNPAFRQGIVNLFFEGASVPFLSNTLPLFELRKFSLGKLNFDPAEMLDTLIRYKERGPRAAAGENNPERVIARIITEQGIDFDNGDLPKFAELESGGKRTMDFIIPNKSEPKLVIECSYVITTSSAQGDKAKTERSIRELLTKHYADCMFVGFLDGIGWIARPGDLERMASAFDDVFTLHEDELTRFSQLLNRVMGEKNE